MMSEILPFTLSYLTRFPQNAASVFERMSVKETVAFLQEIPLAQATRVLETVSPQYASQCFFVFSSERSSELIQAMKTDAVISMLRLMPESARQTIFKGLLVKKRKQLKRSLAYPQDLVGAWMDSDMFSVSETALVGEVRKAIRLSKTEPEYSVYVIRSDGTVLGLLTLSRLIVAKDSIPVTKIIDRDFKVILDTVTMRSVYSLPHWDDFEALPVVNRKDKFVGMLSHKNLKKAFESVEGDSTLTNVDSVLIDGIEAYISTLKWLVQSITTSTVDTSSKEPTNVR
jgi:magnesium transporter